MMVRSVRADRKRQPVAIYNRHDFQAFSAFRRTDFGTAALGHRKGRVDEALFLIQCASVAKPVGNVGQNAAQNFIAAPGLKTAMHGFVIGIALRQHVPLSAGVQNPQRCFQNLARRNGLPPSSAVRNVLFRKMIPDTFPFRIKQPNHSTFIAHPPSAAILR